MKNKFFASLVIIIVFQVCFLDVSNASEQVSIPFKYGGNIENSDLLLDESFEDGLATWTQNNMDSFILQTSTVWAYDGVHSLYCGGARERGIVLIKNLNATFKTLYASEIFKPVTWTYNNWMEDYFLGIGQNDSTSSYLATLGIADINNNGSVHFTINYKTANGNHYLSSNLVPVINATYWLMLKVTISTSVGTVDAFVNGTNILSVSSLNNAIYNGDSVIYVGWMGQEATTWFNNGQGSAYIDKVQASTTVLTQPPYAPVLPPASLVVWTDGTYYYANSTNNTVFFGGASNVNGVNGSSFSQVVTASCVAVDNITLLSGNYVSDNTAYYTSNDKITGQGNSTFIQQKANAPYAASVFSGAAGYTVSNVTISYMWIDGNNQHQTSGTTFNGVENYRQGIQPMQQSNIWVHDMTITNFTECGYDPAWVSNSTIENCVLSGSNGDIWIDVGCIDFVVRNNTVTGINGVAGIREGLGICAVFFDDDGNHTGIITNNTVNGRFDSYSMEIYWGGSATQAFGVSISNNVINGSGIWFSRMSNCTFENNILTYANSGSGILGVILSGSSNIIIRNNIVNYATSFGIYVGSDSRNNTITLNDLRYNFAGPIFDSVMQTQDTVIYNLGLDGYPPP